LRCSPFAGFRVGEALRPGPGRPRKPIPNRWGVDLDKPLISVEEQRLRDRCAALFDVWLARKFSGLATSQIQHNAPLVGNLLRMFGKEHFAAEQPHREFVESILGVRDRHQHLKWSLGSAWTLAERWEAQEPGQCRTVLPRRAMQAMVSVALLWRWWRLAAVLCCGFACPFHPSELISIKKVDMILPSDALEEDEEYRTYIRILEPKTRTRGPRRQHGCVDDPEVTNYLEALYGGAPADEPIYPAGKNAFRTRWNKICLILGINPADVPGGAVPAVIRGSAATEIFKRTEDVVLTQWRGRWQRQKTLEYYLQETGGHSFLSLQTEETRARVRLAASAAPALLAAATCELSFCR
jgi:hypothetical protein